ncbi:hypothetical protein [Labrys monachus]|uniref:Uncharacterized protein n=1 Tax=Labrys monachus TaxID=217067 RepID=A0ABU0FC43_9HYPH|nr:hypothetical protein [Labrys monachus]MDQ0392186.1 hypothetical protein [Labrys monachus]
MIPDPTGGATDYWAIGSQNNSDASKGTKARIQGVLATGKTLQIGKHLFNQKPESLVNRPPANFQTLLAGSQSADQIDRLRDLQRASLASSPEIEAKAAALPGDPAENKARLIDQAETLSEQAPDEGSPQAAPVDAKLSTAWAIAATGMGRMSMTDALAFLRGQIIQEQLQSPGLSEEEAVQRIGRQYGVMDLPLSDARIRKYNSKAVGLPNDPEDWADPRKISGAINAANPPPSFAFPSYVNGRSFHSDAQDLSDRIDAWGLSSHPPASLNFEEPATNTSPQPLPDAGSQEQPPDTNIVPENTGAPQPREAPPFTPPVLPDSMGMQRPFGIFQNLPTSRDTGNGD